MKKGFTYELAPTLVRERPGMTFREVAELALQRGLCQSDAKDQIQSLATTLAKEIREGRQRGILARKVDGQLRCFSATSASPGSGTPPSEPAGATLSQPQGEETVFVSVPFDYIQILDLFVEVGKCSSRGVAAKRFIELGIRHDQGMVNSVRHAVERIREIKKSL